jgi:DsbC/DsbD-like thiol-disulfide interchange protein
VSVQAGSAFRVAVRLVLPDGWHISWKRPGQSGLPTTLAWRVPAGITVGTTEWPFPERVESTGVVSHIYRGEVILIGRFHIVREMPAGTLDLLGRLSWGLCRQICIPQEHDLALSLPVEKAPSQLSPRWAAVAAAAARRLPASLDFLTIRATAVGRDAKLVIRSRQGFVTPVGRVTFFPDDSSQTVVATTMQPQVVAGSIVITVPGRGNGILSGVLVAERGWGGPTNPLALNIDIPTARTRRSEP